jgi:hypothetical protein
LNKKIILLIAALFILVIPSTVFAWGWRRDLPPRHNIIVLRGHRYHYFSGHFWMSGPFGFYIVNPPIGVIVDVLPPQPRAVIIGGITYYYADNVYYTEASGGYVVVPPPPSAPAPVVEQAPATEPASTPPGKSYTVNIPNDDGTFTTVKLVKYKDGYTGPQGEYYPGKPTVDQLRVLYGK